MISASLVGGIHPVLIFLSAFLVVLILWGMEALLLFALDKISRALDRADEKENTHD